MEEQLGHAHPVGHAAGWKVALNPPTQDGQLQLAGWNPVHDGQLHVFEKDMHCGQAHPGECTADDDWKLSSVADLVTAELPTLVFTKAVLGTVKPDTDPAKLAK